MIKKFIAAMMAIIMILALAINAFAASPNVFPDIKDAALTRDVAVLQMLGVVSGDGNGNFVPNGTLTRAAFCKMAVVTMGRGDEESLYRNRTIFPDVRAGHWARGYINLAVSGENKIIKGGNDGYFRPDMDITYAQAVTILVRMLGYTDADAGMLWPDGYLALAKDKGLTEGLGTVAPTASITRAQAAHLFCNLLGTLVKDGSGIYLSKLGNASEDVVIMQLDVRAADGTAGAIRTSAGVVKTVNGIVPPSILGLRGTLVKDKTYGKLLTFLPDDKAQLTITVAQAEATWLKDKTGVQYDIPSDAPTYTASESSTYAEAFIDIAAGMYVTLYFSADGKVECVYINTAKSDGAVVAGADGEVGSLAALTGSAAGYTINKNGAPASLSDIRQYDVISYDSTAKILNVSDFRLTGVYESCWPSMSSPSKMTVFGHEFTVLPSAAGSLAKFKIGQHITVLFTSDLQVAGAVTGVAGTTAIGIVQPGLTATSASVKLLNGLVLKGDPQLLKADYQYNKDTMKYEYAGLVPDDTAISSLQNELVKVNSASPGLISLSKYSENKVLGDLDLTKLTLGSKVLSPAVRVFERVGSGGVAQILLNDLVQTKIDASKILMADLDYAGRVNTLILNDVTGDRYAYGILTVGTTQVNNDKFIVTVDTASVKNHSNTSGTAPAKTSFVMTNGVPAGLAVTADGEYVVNIINLTQVKNISRSAFYTVGDKVYVHLGTMDMPVSKDVECYNSLGKTWFAKLNDARAFSEKLTVYYDRAPSEGGKVRMVVAE